MKYVIIGGVAAGMSAAMEIYRTDDSANITVLERGQDYSYGQCGLPYVVNDLISSTDKVIARTVEDFRNKYQINARTNTIVIDVDVDHQEVVAIDTVTNEEFTVAYDRLLIATGADPIKPNWDGIDLEGIHTFKTITDTNNLLSDLTDDVKKVTVIGAGYIGLELADALKSRGLDVRLIQREDQVAEIFDRDMAVLVQNEAEMQGIEIILEETVKSFSGNGRAEAVITDKQTYPTDLVLLAIGVKPNTEFLNNTGIHKLPNGALIVNAYQETSIKHIYAAGDCATQYHRIKQQHDYIPLGTTANKQGRIAGANMAGRRIAFKGVVGSSIIKFFDLSLGRTGLNENEAKQLNLPYTIISSVANSHAGYYPGAEKLNLRLIYHTETKQLLGGANHW